MCLWPCCGTKLASLHRVNSSGKVVLRKRFNPTKPTNVVNDYTFNDVYTITGSDDVIVNVGFTLNKLYRIDSSGGIVWETPSGSSITYPNFWLAAAQDHRPHSVIWSAEGTGHYDLYTINTTTGIVTQSATSTITGSFDQTPYQMGNRLLMYRASSFVDRWGWYDIDGSEDNFSASALSTGQRPVGLFSDSEIMWSQNSGDLVTYALAVSTLYRNFTGKPGVLLPTPMATYPDVKTNGTYTAVYGSVSGTPRVMLYDATLSLLFNVDLTTLSPLTVTGAGQVGLLPDGVLVGVTSSDSVTGVLYNLIKLDFSGNLIWRSASAQITVDEIEVSPLNSHIWLSLTA